MTEQQLQWTTEQPNGNYSVWLNERPNGNYSERPNDRTATTGNDRTTKPILIFFLTEQQLLWTIDGDCTGRSNNTKYHFWIFHASNDRTATTVYNRRRLQWTIQQHQQPILNAIALDDRTTPTTNIEFFLLRTTERHPRWTIDGEYSEQCNNTNNQFLISSRPNDNSSEQLTVIAVNDRTTPTTNYESLFDRTTTAVDDRRRLQWTIASIVLSLIVWLHLSFDFTCRLIYCCRYHFGCRYCNRRFISLCLICPFICNFTTCIRPRICLYLYLNFSLSVDLFVRTTGHNAQLRSLSQLLLRKAKRPINVISLIVWTFVISFAVTRLM
jgi:hypothetical protein